jgi:HSP20 family molecular chaperone IbpA
MNSNWMSTPRPEPAPEPVHTRPTVAPRVDVYENKNEMLLFVEVPGTTSDTVELHVEKGELTVEAHRVRTTPGPCVASEYHPRDYRRVFVLPPGTDGSRIEAELALGVLRVRLPKSDVVKPRKIEVKAG